jgi:uncharacterized membrane protein
MHFLKRYIVSAITLMTLDTIWIGVIARDFYSKTLGFIITTFEPIPAIVFYGIYAAGLAYFIKKENLKARYTFAEGALFGLCAYAAYDLTNQATIAGWPTIATIVDMAWGAFASGIAATTAAFLTRHKSHI